MTSTEGRLLIAVPKLHDKNFFKSVVLMIRHNADGAFGLTLNRPGSIRVEDVWSQITDSPCHWPGTLFVGGPVEGPLMVLHDQSDASDTEVAPGAFLSVDPEQIKIVFTNPAANAQLYLGYCGWGPGQLEQEMAAGAWITAPAAREHVFEADGELWTRVNRALSAESLRSTLNIKHLPPDARAN